MDKFNQLYKKIMENTTVGSALGATGNPEHPSDSDFYAPGDTRIPKVLGIGKKKKKKKKGIPIYRRNLNAQQ